MWAIVDYLRHLPAGGSLGEPPVYTGECGAQPEHSTLIEPSRPRNAVKGKPRRCALNRSATGF
jgi:hypothetical protein